MSNQPAGRNRSRPSQRQTPGLAARSQAVDLVHAVLSEHKALDTAFERQTTSAGAHAADGALTRALVLTTLRRLPTLDKAINACLDKPLHQSAVKAMTILRVMAAQLLVMDMASHAAVALAVDDTARRKDTRKLKGLVNAVGRRMVREKDALAAAAPASDVPAWLVKRWTETYGAATFAQIAEAMRQQPAIDLSLKRSENVAQWMEELAACDPARLSPKSIRLTKPGAIERLPGYEEGAWWVQDIAATLPATLLLDALVDPTKTKVLDLCAAPGGKTAQLASAGCRVSALDQSASRMKRLEANMDRLNLSVTSQIGDALTWAPSERFDAVLLDAPCSATGTLRRNPDIGYLRTTNDIKALAGLQSDLLRKAASWVKPEGVLVFATCSLEPEEGEAQIARFLGEHSDWQISRPCDDLVPPGTIQENGTVRTLPHYEANRAGPAQRTQGMDGFFVARMRAPN